MLKVPVSVWAHIRVGQRSGGAAWRPVVGAVLVVDLPAGAGSQTCVQ